MFVENPIFLTRNQFYQNLYWGHPQTPSTVEWEGASQMTLLQKPFLKVSTKGGEGSKIPKNCPRGLWIAPFQLLYVQGKSRKEVHTSISNCRKLKTI